MVSGRCCGEEDLMAKGKKEVDEFTEPAEPVVGAVKGGLLVEPGPGANKVEVELQALRNENGALQRAVDEQRVEIEQDLAMLGAARAANVELARRVMVAEEAARQMKVAALRG